jgi:hypothetical protein
MSEIAIFFQHKRCHMQGNVTIGNYWMPVWHQNCRAVWAKSIIALQKHNCFEQFVRHLCSMRPQYDAALGEYAFHRCRRRWNTSQSAEQRPQLIELGTKASIELIVSIQVFSINQFDISSQLVLPRIRIWTMMWSSLVSTFFVSTSDLVIVCLLGVLAGIIWSGLQCGNLGLRWLTDSGWVKVNKKLSCKFKYTC